MSHTTAKTVPFRPAIAHGPYLHSVNDAGRPEPPAPARLKTEAQEVHDARIAAIRRMGARWVMHPAYALDPRHSNTPEVYVPARAAFLAGIASRAADDRHRNPAFNRAQAVRAALGLREVST